MENKENARLLMLNEKNRLDTFKEWKFDNNHACNANKMAEAGFYFIGSKDEPDAVICFLCKKSLDGWVEDDDPWSEHTKHSPNCTFAKLLTPEDALTLKQFLDIRDELIMSTYEENYQELKTKIKTTFSNIMNQLN